MSRLPTQKILSRYEELNQKLLKVNNTVELIKLSKEQKKLQIQAELATEIEELEKSIKANRELLKDIQNDVELLELTNQDLQEQTVRLETAENQLLSHLAPVDPRDDGGVIMEIRAGAGGDESGLFVTDMLRMYSYFADKLGFKLKKISQSLNEMGGYKEVILEITGDGAYSWFKYEAGVHRVQRVPATEKQGRIHTSTVAIIIMPLIEADNQEFKIDPKEIEIILSTSSGHGGQSVNTTYSAVRMKHLPTGIEAQSQDEKNQIQNRAKCLEVLTSRVYDYYEQKRLEEEAKERQGQVKRMDRSEKIRTYNFPQDRVTDHRYNQSWNQLSAILDGGILEIVQDIKKIEAAQQLQKL